MKSFGVVGVVMCWRWWLLTVELSKLTFATLLRPKQCYVYPSHLASTYAQPIHLVGTILTRCARRKQNRSWRALIRFDCLHKQARSTSPLPLLLLSFLQPSTA